MPINFLCKVFSIFCELMSLCICLFDSDIRYGIVKISILVVTCEIFLFFCVKKNCNFGVFNVGGLKWLLS